ncbi:hypothetical protein ES703_72304 [subsurface metagenome]
MLDVACENKHKRRRLNVTCSVLHVRLALPPIRCVVMFDRASFEVLWG